MANFRKMLPPALMGCLLGAFSTSLASAALDPIQSAARPFGLDIVAPVQQASSDPQAAAFQSKELPTLVAWIKKNLPEYTEVKDFSAKTLDPSMLTLKTNEDVRVYFLGEGAGYQNTLGFNTSGAGIKTGDPQLIFPNASSSISTYATTGQSGVRSASEPLMPGDFVNLGPMKAGTQLDFFLISNGANGGSDVYSTTASANKDGLRHVVAYAAKDSPYLLLAFEDKLGGGDKDYNDVLIVLNGTLTTAPEPSTLFILGSFLLPVIYLGRQHSRKQACS
jgi:hypothetical protein